MLVTFSAWTIPDCQIPDRFFKRAVGEATCRSTELLETAPDCNDDNFALGSNIRSFFTSS